MGTIIRREYQGKALEGRWAGCALMVWPEPRGSAWHIEINGRETQTGQLVSWDVYADDDSILIEELTSMGTANLVARIE